MRNNDPFEDLLRSLEENLRRTGEPAPPGSPPEERPVRTSPMGNPRRLLWFLIPLALFWLSTRGLGLWVRWTWFDSVGYEAVFWTRAWTQIGLFVAGALIFYAFFTLCVVLARQLAPWGLSNTPAALLAEAFGLRVVPTVMLAGGVVAVLLGLAATGFWDQVLLYMNQSPYGAADPIFERDISFFLFTLPVWNGVHVWLLVALGVSFAAVVIVSGILWQRERNNRRTMILLGVLAALMLLMFAWQYQISALSLVYSERGSIFGAGHADLRASLPANRIMVLATLLVAAIVLVASFTARPLRIVAVALGVWFVLGLAATGFYPSLVQRFQVGPNEQVLESPYIAQNIRYTRLAYGLDSIETRSYDATQVLTARGLLQEPDTLRNIRLWDYRPLLQTYNQVQALRQYYEFNDIDIDRYTIDGTRRQVMLGARELISDRLSQDAQTWVNQKLVYTHGYGVAASPVAQVTRDGLPTFLVKDLPPQGVIEVTQPQIYFGERTPNYVIVRTTLPEFDYPREDGNVTTQFAAQSGIPMTWANRLLFAVHLGDVNLILNRNISADSRLLWNREISARMREVAPFLLYDSDPYIIIGDDGKLYWMQDAFTASNRFPYSTPQGGLNYIRNSVKIVTDAYDGTMTFYLADPNDPIIAAYQRIFPTLFVPLEQMPADLQDNIRYPEDLFSIQAEVFRTYHMTDPTEFYNREDIWAWPEEVFEDSVVRVDPYSVLMQLPGEGELSYVTILPYTPSNRENMVAWMAVHNDPDKYGQMVVYAFGKDSLFFGPKQVEARIDQDPTISAQLSLWNQQGSNVIRGNLLVIPIADSLLYVEPLYLQAQSGRIPELQRVIVATADTVVMADNLGAALVELFGRSIAADPVLVELGAARGGGSAAAVGQVGVDDAASVVATVEELIVRANRVFDAAQERLRAGDFAGYGEQIEELEALLQELARLEGVPLEAPTPVSTPAATAP